MRPSPSPPTLIVGAGPAGLATAACLAGRGLSFRLVDATGEPGGAYREMYDGIELASPSSMNSLPGLDLSSKGPYNRVPEYREYLLRYARHHRLPLERGLVERVERDVAGFRVTIGGEQSVVPAVIVATGKWCWPVLPEPPGAIPLLHAKAWRGPQAHPVGRLLVLGGATSAVEIAEEAAGAGIHVTISARSGVRITPRTVLGVDVHHWVRPLEWIPPALARHHCDTAPVKPAADAGFARLRAEGRIEVRPGIAGSSRDEVQFEDGTRASFDLAVAATGYRHVTPFLPDEVARAKAGHLLAHGCRSPSWPGLFVVGAPCARGLDSEYLRGIARDAAHVAGLVERHRAKDEANP